MATPAMPLVQLFRQSKRRVANKRNSYISVPIEWHDWSNWWTDGANGSLYLHVKGNVAADPDGIYGLESRAFRVYPRIPKGFRENARLTMDNGELFWLLDGAV
jgi:hypothetical protein